MGMGDEIMAAGLAAQKAREAGGPVAILDRQGRPRWSDVWKGNPDVATPEEFLAKKAKASIVCGPYARPYIERWETWSSKARCVFSSWQARSAPGRIYLTPSELQLAEETKKKLGHYIIVEPALVNSNPNKEWGVEKYQEVLRRFPDEQFVQMGPAAPARLLEGAYWVQTSTYRDACAVLSAARAALLPEGGLHHAAAALGVPAVVIFGGHTHPDSTGYDGHINLVSDIPETPCGRYAPCPHCREAMDSICVITVVDALGKILEGKR